jgi:hypothetical protein
MSNSTNCRDCRGITDNKNQLHFFCGGEKELKLNNRNLGLGFAALKGLGMTLEGIKISIQKEVNECTQKVLLL